MLITEFIKIKMNRGNLGFYNKKMNRKLKIGDIVDVPIDKIPKSMYVEVEVSCDICSGLKTTTYRNYNDCLKYGFYTCNSCKHIKRKMTNKIKYGEENFNNEIKRKETLDEKYGFYYNNREKSKITCYDKYGFDNVSKVDEFKDKKENTMLEKWGVKNPTYIESINKINSTEGYIKYNADQKTHTLFCKGGHNYEIDTNLFYNRYYRGVETCTVCNKINSSSSSYEDLIYDFIKDNYNGKIIKSFKDKFEIDIYLPDLKIGIEINGLYWHSSKFKDKNYHIDKTKYFKERGIRIIHLWEDDIIFKIDIVKSMILNYIKKSKRLFARKCNIINIEDKSLVKKFLDENHIQGYNSDYKISIGLIYNGDLVSVMCFNDLEGRKRIKDGGYNISRFCNKLNTTVVGGASKLLNHFIKNNSPKYLISYAEYSNSDGQLYLNLGFKLSDKIYPDYKYIAGNKRIHKSNFKKDKLGIKGQSITEKEFTEKNGIYRIWDCGKLKFTLCL